MLFKHISTKLILYDNSSYVLFNVCKSSYTNIKVYYIAPIGFFRS